MRSDKVREVMLIQYRVTEDEIGFIIPFLEDYNIFVESPFLKKLLII